MVNMHTNYNDQHTQEVIHLTVIKYSFYKKKKLFESLEPVFKENRAEN